MKMRTLRKLRTLAPRDLPRRTRRFDFDVTDATVEPDPGPPPEAVFDRVTGPWDRRRSFVMPGASDEET
jgi:hypothetical protein